MELTFRIAMDILSAIYVLVLPGLILSYAVYGGKELPFPDRIMQSVAMSLAAVSVTVMYLAMLGFPVSPATVVVDISGIIILSVVFIVARHMVRARKGTQ